MRRGQKIVRMAILLGGASLLFSATLVLQQEMQKPEVASNHEETIHCVGTLATDFTCHKRRVEMVASVLGTAPALRNLHVLYENNSFVRSQCHQLAHAIGNVAARKAKDISNAFVDGDSICWSGYYHGVVEEYVQLRGKDTFQRNANTMCAKISDKVEYGFDYYNCVHGLGHGVMAITKNQLFLALTLCEQLSGDWERRSCYGGVFMENIMTDNRNHYAPNLKPDDLLYPCNAVEEQYKEECYKMQTSYALSKNGYDFGQLFALCASAEEGYRRTCAQSIGRDASGQSTSDIPRTISWCALARTDEQKTDCYIGAVKDFVAYFHSDKEARALCFAVASEFQPECERALLEQWRTVNSAQ